MRGLTLRQIAEQFGVAYSTARQWQAQKRFPNSKLEETPLGKIWIVPKSDLKTFQPPKMGRPKGKRTTTRKQTKKR